MQHVIAGLDPAIHHEVVDARVKPAHDTDIVEPRDAPIAQYCAAYVIDTARHNRLYKAMQHVRAELKAMSADQRRALLPLLSHPNVQVRLKAAHSLLALYPGLARKALEAIRDSGIEPQNGEAASAIGRLDEGVYIPT